MDGFDKLIGLYDKIGFGGMLVAFLAIFVCVFLYNVLKKLGDMLLDKVFSRKKKRKIELEDHDIFNRLNLSLEHKIPKIKIRCPLRKRVFKKVLITQHETLKRSLKKISSQEIKKMSNEQHRKFWENLLDTNASVFEEWCEKDGIPEIAFRKFQDFNAFNEELMRKTMYQICDAEMIYDSSLEKACAIMDFMSAVMDISLLSAEKTIDSLNGELSTESFEGISCTCCTDGCEVMKAHE